MTNSTEYSQGICGDGAAILKSGQMLTIEEIVSELRQCADERDALKVDVEDLKHDIGRYIQHASALAEEVERLTMQVKRLESEAVPNERGTNRYGLDVAYFRNLINRELNRPLVDFRPDELARVFARASVAADRNVIKEPEFTRATEDQPQ